jgi:hypothetical protein
LNRSIKPPGDENGRDGEASTLLAEGVAKPSTGRIAVKVINHLGDEVMKVYRIK